MSEIKNLKKVDLHRHVEGSVNPKIIFELCRRNGNKQETLAYFQEKMVLKQRAGSLDEFIRKLGTCFLKKYVKSCDDLVFVFRQAVRNAAIDNIDYLELRFALSNFLNLEKNPTELVRKIVSAVREESRELVIEVELLITLKRDDEKTVNFKVVEIAQDLYGSGDIGGLDLAGNEHFFPNEFFVDLGRKIEKAGIPLTVHAGEVTNAQSVSSAVTLLGARRIGHGTRVAFDKSVMELLVRENVLLEVCPTSNLDTSAYKTYEEVPIRKLLDNQVPLIICTDDPVTSNITLSWEVENLIKRKIVTLAEYKKMLSEAQDHYFRSN